MSRINLLVVVAVPAIATIPLLACSSDNKASPDAPVIVIDAPGSGSGSGSGSNNVCLLPTSLGATTFMAQSVRYRSGTGSGSGSGLPRANRLSITGALDGSATQEIQFTIYGGCGTSGSNCSGSTPNTPDWPTTFAAKSGIDLAAAVDASALAAGGVGSQGGTFGAQAIYLISAGTLNVTAAGNGSGAAFAGTASNLTFVHVDIGSAGATPSADGCQMTVSSLTFSGSAAFNGKVIVLDDLDAGDAMVLHHRYQ